MSNRAVQTLFLTALTDRHHRDALLSGCPTAYDGFDLSDDEISILQSIRPATLADFAAQAHWLLYAESVAPAPEAWPLSPPAAQPELNCA